MKKLILYLCCLFNLTAFAQWNAEIGPDKLLAYEKYPENHPKYNVALINEASVNKNDIAPELFSNPSTGILTVHLENTMPKTKICVYDAWGNCVHNEVIAKKNKLKIDLSAQPKGIYLMEIRTGSEKAVTKIELQ